MLKHSIAQIAISDVPEMVATVVESLTVKSQLTLYWTSTPFAVIESKTGAFCHRQNPFLIFCDVGKNYVGFKKNGKRREIILNENRPKSN